MVLSLILVNTKSRTLLEPQRDRTLGIDVTQGLMDKKWETGMHMPWYFKPSDTNKGLVPIKSSFQA